MNKEHKCLEGLQYKIKQNKDLDYFSSVFSEKFLLHFVRGRKYDCDKAYETLIGYINIRSGKHKEWFRSIQPSSFRRIETNPMRVLKHRDHLNRLIVIIEFRYWNPRDLPMDEALKLVMLDIDEFMNYEDAEKNGVVAIYDFTEYNIQHAKCITPNALYKAIQICWKNVPLSYKAFHMVNEMYLVTMLFKGIKPILPTKLKERMYFHSSDYDSLHQSVSAEILPESLGGHLSNDEAFDEKYSENIFNKDKYYERFSKLL